MSCRALTSMPYAFTSRSWEMFTVDSIDILDSLASSVKIQFTYSKILRILPRLDEKLNEDWITNKARFIYDSFFKERITNPFIRINNKLINISWFSALNFLLKFLNHVVLEEIETLLGPFTDLPSLFQLKLFFML